MKLNVLIKTFKKFSVLPNRFWLPSGPRPMGTYCLEFFYHMRGANVATLAVIRRWKGVSRVSAIWQRSGNLGPEWRKASLDIFLYRRLKVRLLAELP